jgi:hypothetical protein
MRPDRAIALAREAGIRDGTTRERERICFILARHLAGSTLLAAVMRDVNGEPTPVRVELLPDHDRT